MNLLSKRYSSRLIKNNYKLPVCCLFIALITLSSCVSTHRGFQSSPVIIRNVDLDPIKADITVNENKVVGESTSNYFKLLMPFVFAGVPLYYIRVNGDKTYVDGIKYSTDIIYPQLVINSLVSKVRASAAYNALENTDADFLVNPNYSVKVRNTWFLTTITVSVTGFPASYSNFRTEGLIKVFSENDNILVVPD